MMNSFTEYLAIYGAGLSTIVFIWNVLRTRSFLKVRITEGLSKIDGEYNSGVFISIQNPSLHTQHISAVALAYPFEQKGLKQTLYQMWEYKRIRRIGWCTAFLSVYDIDDGCPVSIESGKSHQVFVAKEVLKEMLSESERKEIIAMVQDQLSRDKYSSIHDLSEFKFEWQSD